jgi:hypothetical protein
MAVLPRSDLVGLGNCSLILVANESHKSGNSWWSGREGGEFSNVRGRSYLFWPGSSEVSAGAEMRIRLYDYYSR